MKGKQQGEKWNKNEKERAVERRSRKVKRQNFALYACPKRKVDLFDPERKGS